MYIVIFCCIVAVYLAYLESKGKMTNGMLWGFVPVTVLGMIHYNYGNDYMSYYAVSEIVDNTPFDLQSILNGDVYREPGWALLCYVFKPLGGFFMMVAVLNLVQNYIYYSSIKKYVPQNWWWLAVALYLGISNLYLMNFSMMRQGLAVAVFLACLPLIREKKVIPLLFIYVALSMVHSSFKFCLPFLFVGYLSLNATQIKYISISMVLLVIAMWINADIINIILTPISDTEEFQTYMETYGANQQVGFSITSIGAWLKLIPFITSSWFLLRTKNIESDVKLLAVFTMIGGAIQPISQIVNLAGRMSFYFYAYSVLGLPNIFISIKKTQIRNVILSVYLIVTFYDFYLMFVSAGWSDHYRVFHSIFEVL